MKRPSVEQIKAKWIEYNNEYQNFPKARKNRLNCGMKARAVVRKLGGIPHPRATLYRIPSTWKYKAPKNEIEDAKRRKFDMRDSIKNGVLHVYFGYDPKLRYGKGRTKFLKLKPGMLIQTAEYYRGSEWAKQHVQMYVGKNSSGIESIADLHCRYTKSSIEIRPFKEIWKRPRLFFVVLKVQDPFA